MKTKLMTVIYPTVPPQLFFRKSVVPAVVVPYQSTNRGHGSLPTIRPPLSSLYHLIMTG